MPTMKVRVMSGSQTGIVVELDRVEAESGLASGFFATVQDEATEEPKPVEVKALRRVRPGRESVK